MAYERLNLKTGDELNEAVFKRIDDGIETHDKVLGDARQETYIEVERSSNLFNPAATPTGEGKGCFSAYFSQTGYSENNKFNQETPDAYIENAPSLTSGVARQTENSSGSTGITHYFKVQAGKTYLIKSNSRITQTSEITGNSYEYGVIKYLRLDTTGGKWIWESNAYNIPNWNKNCTLGEYGGEVGSGSPANYGTTYAEIKDTLVYQDIDRTYGVQGYVIKFNIDGWLRICVGHPHTKDIWGTMPSRNRADAMTEETFRTILNNIQINETIDSSTPFEEFYEREVEKIRYASGLTDYIDELQAGIDNLKTNFVETPIWSKNLYPSTELTNNNQYMAQQTAETWSNTGYNPKGNPTSAAMRVTSPLRGKNLCSGWVKIIEPGIYTIEQFKQIPDSYANGKMFGYIGAILGATGSGELVFDASGFTTGTGTSLQTTDYVRAITKSAKNLTKYTFEKYTTEPVYINWFMSGYEGNSMNGYHLPSDKSYPTVSAEEMAQIKNNTMLYQGYSVKQFEPYSPEPVGYNYLVGIDSIDGLRDALENAGGGGAASSLNESITIGNSDKIGFFGNSFMQGCSCEGQHPLTHLGSWSDYIFYNYSSSGDDILETLERVENNKIKFNGLPPKDWNLTYAVIAQQDNDGALHAVHYETYYENSKKLAKYLAGFGAQCILGTEHDTQAYYYNMMRLAREEGYMFMDWGYLADHSNPASFKPFNATGHPSTRTQWSWTSGMKQFFDTLPRPRKSIKLFNARDVEMDNNDLTYNTNIERAKVWQDFSAGYAYKSNLKYFDRQCETDLGAGTNGTKASEYLELQAGKTAVGKPKVLAEIITPYTSTHLNKLKIHIDTTADKVYIKRNTSLVKPISAKRYLSFGIGENDPSVFVSGGTLVVAAGATGNVTGSNIEGTYIIEGVAGGVVVTTTASSGRETSGTDNLEATVNGTPIALLAGSYDYPSADYGLRWNKPLCEWEEIELDEDGCFTIEDIEKAKCYFDFDKVGFLLENSAGDNITITDVSATVSGNGEKNRDSGHKILKPIIGTSKFSDVDFAKSTKWTIVGDYSYPSKLTYTQVSGSAAGSVYTEKYPNGTTSTIQIENGTRMSAKISGITKTYYTAPTIQVRILARRLPPVIFTDEDFETKNVITPSYYPCGTLKVGLGTKENPVDCDYFGAMEVGLDWYLYIFNIPVQSGSTDILSIYSESDWMQIARVEVDQISNYVTFS